MAAVAQNLNRRIKLNIRPEFCPFVALSLAGVWNAVKPGLIGVSLGTLGGECDVGHMGGCRLTQARQQLQIVTRRGPIAALRHASVDVQPSCHATRCSPAVYHASRAHGGGLRGRDSYRTGPAIQFVPLPVSRLRLELGTPTELIQDSHHAANFSVWYPGQALPNTRSFFPVLRGNCGTRARLASGDVLSNIATTWTSKTVLKGAKKSREEVVAPTTSGISGGLASAVFTRKYRRQFSGFSGCPNRCPISRRSRPNQAKSPRPMPMHAIENIQPDCFRHVFKTAGFNHAPLLRGPLLSLR